MMDFFLTHSLPIGLLGYAVYKLLKGDYMAGPKRKGTTYR